jgi:hypothetical protein
MKSPCIKYRRLGKGVALDDSGKITGILFLLREYFDQVANVHVYIKQEFTTDIRFLP